jgi:16S rRNA (cytosine967-C5)-methyltransferase
VSESQTQVSPARRAAYEVLRRTFEHEAWTDRAFHSAAERHRLEGRDLALGRRLAYGAVQRRGTSDHLIDAVAERPPERLDPPVLAALRLGIYELLYSRSVPAHAVVDQAVELAKGGAGGRKRRRREAAAGLANAVLRRIAREREALLSGLDDSTPEGAATAHSYPAWLARVWWRELGAESARAQMRAMNEPAETAFRVNTLRADPERLVAELQAAGGPVRRGSGDTILDPPEALVVEAGVGEAMRAAVADGLLIPQSRASQAVVAVLDPGPGERVVDSCAGPGIKTTQIAARIENRGDVAAFELDPARAAQVKELCARAGVSCASVTVGDAARVDLGDGYDRALVDPPCSDLGALASRPDARWRKSPEQVGRLAELQRTLLERAAGALRPGGIAVYATCTISADENEGVVSAVVASDPSLEVDQLGPAHPALAASGEPRALQTLPDRDGTAGFFIARLRRRG